MKRGCVTAYYRRYSRSDSLLNAPQRATEGYPMLSLCILGNTVDQDVVQSIRDEVGNVVVMTGTSLRSMINVVTSPWWMLLYENEYLTKGLLAALPQLVTFDAASNFEGFTFFRIDTAIKNQFTYHTRLINSLVPYNVTAMRPAVEGRYERILNGWVVYDQHHNKNERRVLQEGKEQVRPHC